MTIPITRQQLLAEFKAGDQAAYNFITSKYFPAAQAVALGHVKNELKAEMIAASALKRLWSSRQEIPDGSSILAYVFKFTREAAEKG